MDWGHGSLIKLCGPMQIKVLQSTHFCSLDNTGTGTALPATHKLSHATAAAVISFNRMMSGQSTQQTRSLMRPLKLVLQCQLWPWSFARLASRWNLLMIMIMMMMMLNGVASPCRLLFADWPSIWDLSGSINQMTVFEIIIAILHCLSDCVLAYYARSCKCCRELGLCLANSAHATRARYRTISGCSDNRKVTDSAIDIAISPNWYEP